MLIHKCKLAILSEVDLTEDKLKITLNNEDSFKIHDYEGPQFKCGRFCIYRINSKRELSNLYLLDNQNKPFQVYGINDVLLEGSVIYDSTKEISKEISYATQLCIHAYNVLFKNEIEENKELLLELENKIFNFVLRNKCGWKTSKKNVCDLLNDYKLPDQLKIKMDEALKIAPMPKASINKKPYINLEEYTNSAFVRI